MLLLLGMMKSPVFFIFATSVFVMGIVHVIALELSLYWRYDWLDIPMHILGGFSVAFGFYTLCERKIFIQRRHVTLFPLLFLVLIVGLLWEVFEIWAGIPLLEDDFETDIAYDLIMDIAGGFLGWVVAKSLNVKLRS